MKLKLEKQQLISIAVMIAAALIISFGISMLPNLSAPLATPSIPEPVGVYYKPICEDGFGGWYTLLIPEDWDGLIEAETKPDENGAYYTNIYSIRDREEGGGLLFSLRFYPEGTDFSMLPYTEVGIVETPEGVRYHFVYAPPSDMQFAVDNAENYIAMQEQGLSVADTADFIEEYTLTPIAGCGMP